MNFVYKLIELQKALELGVKILSSAPFSFVNAWVHCCDLPVPGEGVAEGSGS